MGKHATSKEDLEAYRWCIKNRILIYPVVRDYKSWYVQIDLNGVKNLSPTAYVKDEIWTKIYEFYNYYYKKRKQ